MVDIVLGVFFSSGALFIYLFILPSFLNHLFPIVSANLTDIKNYKDHEVRSKINNL